MFAKPNPAPLVVAGRFGEDVPFLASTTLNPDPVLVLLLLVARTIIPFRFSGSEGFDIYYIFVIINIRRGGNADSFGRSWLGSSGLSHSSGGFVIGLQLRIG